MNARDLSQAELDAFDPGGGRKGGRERRWLCPLCHGDRKPNEAHRCLCVNTMTGAWNCKRCGEKGLLIEHRDQAPKPFKSKAAITKSALRRILGASPEPSQAPARPPVDPEPPRYDFRAEIKALMPLAGTPGADYLASRGIPFEIAHRAGGRYSPAYLGRPAVVFGLRDATLALVGASGRHTDGLDPSKRTIKKDPLLPAGAFIVPGALEAETVVIVEAPIDALSLLTAGILSVATNGTACPPWLVEKLALRHVMLAHDRDKAGDDAAAKIATEISPVGAKVMRLRPPDGCKDWNDALKVHGAEVLQSSLAFIEQKDDGLGGLSDPRTAVRASWGQTGAILASGGSIPMPEHLQHQGLVIWSDSIAENWAWQEWLKIYSRRPESPSMATTEEAVRYVIEQVWKAS